MKQYHKTFKKPESVQGKSRSTSKSFVMALRKVVNTKTSQMKMTPTFEFFYFNPCPSLMKKEARILTYWQYHTTCDLAKYGASGGSYQTPKRTGSRACNTNVNLLNEGLFPRRMFDSYKLKSIKVNSESNNGDRLELLYRCILYCLEMNLRD